jgi:transcriptional regulator with XRE-family HTH domain
MKYTDDGFAKRLKALRQNRGYTQAQVAEVLSIDRTTYTYYESGHTNPPREVLHRLVQLFDVSYEELLCGEQMTRVRIAENGAGMDLIYNLPKDEMDLLAVIRTMSPDEKREMAESAQQIIRRHNRPSTQRKQDAE